jgi:hypothetical protein
VLESDEQPLEIVFAGLLDLTALDANIVDDEFAFRNRSGKIVAQRGQIAGKFLAAFLECHQNAGLAELLRSVDQKARGQQCLAGTGATADESRAAMRPAAVGNFVQALNAGGRFGKLLMRRHGCLRGLL